MWSTAYGLIALALVAAVVLYTALHTTQMKSLDVADDLYAAKRGAMDYFFTDSLNVYKRNAEVSYYVLVNLTTTNGTVFTVGVPVAYKLQGEARYYIYTAVFNVTRCTLYAAKAYGEPGVLYEIDVKYPLNPAPWFEVYAVAPVAWNWTDYLYQTYRQSRPILSAVDGWNTVNVANSWLFALDKTEWAYVTNGTYSRLYVLTTRSAVGVVVVDYPTTVFLGCKNLTSYLSIPRQGVERRDDTPTPHWPAIRKFFPKPQREPP
jgi:hypothetical protein